MSIYITKYTVLYVIIMHVYDIKPIIEANNMTEYMTNVITNNITCLLN